MLSRPTELPIVSENITMLYQAAGNPKNGATEIKAIIEKTNLNVSEIKDPAYKPANAAATTGSLSTLKYLIEECAADIDAKDSDNLFICALKRPEHLRYLTNPRFKIYEKFNDGTNDLSAAIMRGDGVYIRKTIPIGYKPINLRSKEAPALTRLFFWVGISGNQALY